MNDILVGAEFPAGIGGLAALDIPGFLQLIDSGADGILALTVDMRKTGQGIIPILRKESI